MRHFQQILHTLHTSMSSRNSFASIKHLPSALPTSSLRRLQCTTQKCQRLMRKQGVKLQVDVWKQRRRQTCLFLKHPAQPLDLVPGSRLPSCKLRHYEFIPPLEIDESSGVMIDTDWYGFGCFILTIFVKSGRTEFPVQSERKFYVMQM